MAIKREYTITPLPYGKKGFKVNYTIEGWSPGTTETKHREFTSEAEANKFVEQLKKHGWKA